MKPIERIWTPEGLKPVYGMERVEIPALHMQAFRDFAEIAGTLGLGLHCSKCGSDLVGKNGLTDRVHAMSCGCREFVGENPRVTPMPAGVQ